MQPGELSRDAARRDGAKSWNGPSQKRPNRDHLDHRYHLPLAFPTAERSGVHCRWDKAIAADAAEAAVTAAEAVIHVGRQLQVQGLLFPHSLLP